MHIPVPTTIADGARAQHVGELAFASFRHSISGIFTATDAELLSAMRLLAGALKLVVEPTGCLALAAAISHKEQLRGRRIGVVLSGGNIDPRRFAELIAGPT